jgi:hypothetical protein
MAPPAPERAALQEYVSTKTRAVVYGESLNIGDKYALAHDVPLTQPPPEAATE